MEHKVSLPYSKESTSLPCLVSDFPILFLWDQYYLPISNSDIVDFITGGLEAVLVLLDKKYNNRSLKNILPLLQEYLAEYKTAHMQNLFSAFTLMIIINELLEIGKSNLI
jgi:hypothetical protein